MKQSRISSHYDQNIGPTKSRSRSKMQLHTLCLILASVGLANCSGVYQFVAQQQQQLQAAYSKPELSRFHSGAPNFPVRRLDEVSKESLGREEDSEAQQLHHLHQVVDTVAQLLGEEDRQHDGWPQRSKTGDSPQIHSRIHELMSESEIRQAIEELEKVQQQERQAAESQQRPTLEASGLSPVPQPAALKTDKKSAIESLLDELGEELIEDQLAAASQEAERLVQQGDSVRMRDKSPADETVAESDFKRTNSSEKPQLISESAPTRKPNQTSVSTIPNSLYVGQLETLGSEMSNDFQSFQADSNGSDRVQESQQEPAPMNVDRRTQHQAAAQPRQKALSALAPSDLEPAAQTRNSVERHEPLPAPAFEHQGPPRFEFDHPAPLDNQQPRGPLSQSNQEALIRAFRQQTGANIDGNRFPPTSTFLPIQNQENFWRPSNSPNQAGQGNSNDINQQYDRVRSIQQGLPPLPASRFQSLSPVDQFSQPVSSTRQSQHIHFTGHSLIPSSNEPRFSSPHQIGNLADREHQSFSSTATPLISVLSGSDTSAGNSVSWNPPSTIIPPPNQQSSSKPTFNRQFPSPMQPSQLDAEPENSHQPLFPAPNHGPPSPLFQGAFQGLPGNRVNGQPSSQLGFRQPSISFESSTEVNNIPESTTVDRFPPVTTTHWSLPATPSGKEVSDSQHRSAVRSIQNEQRFFSPNDLSGTTSTLSPIDTETPKPSRINAPVVATTNPPNVTANTTKKEDMVIYYYYYYDDNKNATVVAKNVTSGSTIGSAPLDPASEADGGIEDTPYMDDPTPISNPRPASNKTVGMSDISTSSNNFESSNRDEGNFKAQTNPARINQPAEPPHSGRQSQFERDFSAQPAQNDQPRTSLSSSTRGPPSRQQEPANSPFSVPTSFKPGSRAPNHELTTNNRFLPTDSTDSRGHSTPIRTDTSSSFSAINSPSPSSKLQNDIINNVLNGITSAPPRQPASLSTVSTPVASSANNNRGSLSNASRYGTNNNLMLDPYGLDPAAPATLAHSGHPSAVDGPASHKNWQISNPVLQSNRRPASSDGAGLVVSSPSPVESLTSPKSHGSSANRPSSQQFSAQRNSNPSTISTSTTTTTTTTTVSSIPQRVPQQSRQANTRNNLATVVQASKQLFPETNNSNQIATLDSKPNELISRVSATSTSHRQTLQEQSNISPKSNKDSILIGSADFGGNKLITNSEESLKLISGNNGRPSTSEGNTGNGFTRSPIQVSPVGPTAQPPTIQRQQVAVNDRAVPFASIPVSSTQATVSTSVSRSFVTPQQGLVTTSVSPPVVTYTTVSSTLSQSQSQAQANTTTTTINPATSSISSTGTPQEVNQPTDRPESIGASTRKKFGNRNNRFQTRLSSLSASSSRSSSTTSTTETPSSTSTTRRPTTSTTRKSSKQLFAGRRRLSSAQTPDSNSSANQIQIGSSGTSPTVDSSQSSPSSSSTGRLRFGNSFTARGRSATVSSSTAVSDQNASTQKPSLFGAQRGTSKPRLPFLKTNKQSVSGIENTSSAVETSTGSNSSNSSSGENVSPVIDTEKIAIEKSATHISDTSEEPLEDTSVGSAEEEAMEKKDSLVTSSVPEITTIIPSTSTAESTTAARNKPKVRPLFASRQRNSSLFGNRRSNSTSTS